MNNGIWQTGLLTDAERYQRRHGREGMQDVGRTWQLTGGLDEIHGETVPTHYREAAWRNAEILIQYVRAHVSVITRVATNTGINSRDLELTALIHLPRLVHDGRCPPSKTFVEEVTRLASVTKEARLAYAWLSVPPADLPSSPTDTRMVKVTEQDAFPIEERFHYLGSPRANSLHYGLITKGGHLMALTTLSPFDLKNVFAVLPHGIDGSEVGVISRVYSFDWAPRNAISYMMGQVLRLIRREKPELKILLTYVNPNLGFRGTSYKASNWIFFGREWGTRYMYIDGQYQTDRQISSRFGITNPRLLKNMLGTRFEATAVLLAPLLMYAYILDTKLSHVYSRRLNNDFWRP